MMTQVRKGGCQCGQVRFEAEGEPENVRACHCRQCQKATGAPFFARALYPQAKVAITGRLTRFASSERIDRAACAACGGALFSLRTDGVLMGVALAAFDEDIGLPLTQHTWLADKATWLTLPDDGAERYDGFAPA